MNEHLLLFMEAIILEQLLVRTSGISSWLCFSTVCFSPVCGLTDLLYDKHRWLFGHEDWQMESHRRLLVAAPQKFLCPLEEASLQGSVTPHAALGTACSCPSSLPAAQKSPQCFKVNKWVFSVSWTSFLECYNIENCWTVVVLLLSCAELTLTETGL